MSPNHHQNDIRLRRPSEISNVTFRTGHEGVTPEKISTLYRRAPLHRSTGFRDQIEKMFQNASIIVTGWQNDRLIAVARVLSDGVLYSYICDFAVEPDVQGLGVGRQLLERVFTECAGTDVFVADAPARSEYYATFGFKPVGNAWVKKA